ncbi:MAG: hypothetical protein H7A32_02550 [Deltaproteobacteria bacterium]|nr:hypothetical protein [Deltaproteobacteria bacterium]
MKSKEREFLGVESRAYLLSQGRLADRELDIKLLLKTAGIQAIQANLNFPREDFQRAIDFVYQNLKSEYQGFPFQDAQNFILSLVPHKRSVMELLLVEYSKKKNRILGTVLVSASRNLRHFKTMNFASQSWNQSLKGTCYELRGAFSRAFSVAKPHVYMEIAYYIVDPHLRKNNELRVGEHLLKNLTRFKNILSLELHEKVIFFGGMHKRLATKPRIKPLIKPLPKSHFFHYPGDPEKSVIIVSTL